MPFRTLLPSAHQYIRDITKAPSSSINRSEATLEAAHAARWFLKSAVAEDIRRSGCLLRVSTDHFIERGFFSREVRELTDITWVRITAPGRVPWMTRTLAVLEINSSYAPMQDEPCELLKVTRFGLAPSGRGLCKAFSGIVADRSEALAELGQVPHQMSLLSIR